MIINVVKNENILVIACVVGLIICLSSGRLKISIGVHARFHVFTTFCLQLVVVVVDPLGN
jgi:choline-glycine betaine transporter